MKNLKIKNLDEKDIQNLKKNQNHRAGRNETSGFENSENKN